TSRMVRGDAGRLGFTDHTACRTWFRKPSVAVRLLRTTNVTPRMALGPAAAIKYADIEGQYTVAGACWYRPFSRTSCTTPMTSCQGMPPSRRSRRPIAAAGVPQSARARFSEITTTGRKSYTSVHVISRPATTLVPAVRKNPGDAYLNRGTGGESGLDFARA